MLIKTIDVGKMAFDPVLTPDEEFVWVPVKSSNELVVISTDTWTEVVARIKDDNLKQPQQIVFSADGACGVRHEQQQDGPHGRSGACRPCDAGSATAWRRSS